MKQEACIEILEALMQNTQKELLKVIKENKELRIRLAFLEEENKRYNERRKGWKLVNVGKR